MTQQPPLVCSLCGKDLAAFKKDGEIASYNLKYEGPPLPPLQVFMCTNCGLVHIFCLQLRNTPKKFDKTQIPDEVKKNLGIV